MAFKLTEARVSQSLRHDRWTLKEQLIEFRKTLENDRLMRMAQQKCENGTVLQWLQQISGSSAFKKIGELFSFFRRHIEVEEKKDHGNMIDITLLAHGAIRDSMIPACCLLPLPTIMDVVLYNPWNCTIDATAAYGIATGIMKPQHRIFICSKKDSCSIRDAGHRPVKLPNHWNSMSKAGEHMIPNITLAPLNVPEDGYFKSFESLTKKYGLPERNRIIIPYIVPAEETKQGKESIPFYVVSLALSLALVGSRFRATVHLTTCLGDQSVRKFDQEYLKSQYACAVDNSMMTASSDMFKKRPF
ncbi:uncharacterized protein LOC117832678 [Xyrichtys novacula]|uniref:Uncharacterized protein LOC117832678 n=1 Tax=Xyrichtys novacula TaxID=13765 RepID=A0AAV1GQU2_XYRNO|nr:uncharacterized protein LOC117832678 [Xyrichtys novacula]